MSQEIQDKVVAIIVEKLNCEASEVTPEANFSSDLGADSLDTVELIMEFEKAFYIQMLRASRLLVMQSNTSRLRKPNLTFLEG